jgi:hypothetical protein
MKSYRSTKQVLVTMRNGKHCTSRETEQLVGIYDRIGGKKVKENN